MKKLIGLFIIMSSVSAFAKGGGAGNNACSASITKREVVTCRLNSYLEAQTQGGQLKTWITLADCNPVSPRAGIDWWELGAKLATTSSYSINNYEQTAAVHQILFKDARPGAVVILNIDYELGYGGRYTPYVKTASVNGKSLVTSDYCQKRSLIFNDDGDRGSFDDL